MFCCFSTCQIVGIIRIWQPGTASMIHVCLQQLPAIMSAPPSVMQTSKWANACTPMRAHARTHAHTHAHTHTHTHTLSHILSLSLSTDKTLLEIISHTNKWPRTPKNWVFYVTETTHHIYPNVIQSSVFRKIPVLISAMLVHHLVFASLIICN